ncbi:MAG: sporulation protein YunB [Peptococcaceae bacterium]|nr:sporulation protein YunB [Peptococcaceae bacterium]
MFKKRRRFRPVYIIVFLGFILALGFWVIEYQLYPTIVSIAKAKAVQVSVNTVNKSVQACLAAEKVRYQELIHIHKNDNGRIAMMQADTMRLAQLAASFAVTAENHLKNLEQDQFTIPLGQVIGSQLLATYGPRIPVRIIPVGAVRVNMTDQFEAAGINQTRHRIYLDLDASVRIVIPWQDTEVDVVTRVPLVENIIVGEVPETVVTLDGGLLGRGGLFNITEENILR